MAMCPKCHSFALKPEKVAGRGEVYSFTLVGREFTPNYKPPYVAALVELVAGFSRVILLIATRGTS